MYFRTLLVSSVLALMGCQSAEVVTQQATFSVVETTQELSFLQMDVPSSKKVIIGDGSQVLRNSLIDSPVAAFELPANRGKLEIKITSQITDSVFSPLVLILDKEGNVVDSYDASVFEYRRPKLIFGDRLVAELNFYPPTGLKSVQMIIYTTNDELAKETMSVHPGRAMAEAKGNYMPELKDIAKPHVLTGTVLVEIDGANNIEVVEQKSSTVKVDSKMIQPQTESSAFYKASIQAAVNENDIPKALALLEEAKALNIEGAQDAFVNAVNKHK